MTALRVFEAAARHGSFKSAAGELNVTPVAVTRQIRNLEQEFGLNLFERLHRGVRLTREGEDLAARLVPAFDRIREAVEGVRRGRIRERLTISTDRQFGRLWLVPRLDAFRAGHPEIAVDVVLSGDPPLPADAADATIYYDALRNSAHGEAELLFRDLFFPVCSPALIGGDPPLDTPADLARHRLLHESTIDWWRRWLESAEVDEVDPLTGTIFEDDGSVYDAAERGEGVALGDDIVIAERLRRGSLVRPFEPAFDGGTYMLVPTCRPMPEAYAPFRSWIVAEAGRHKREMASFLRGDDERRWPSETATSAR